MEGRNNAKINISTQKTVVWDEYQRRKKDAETKGDPMPPLPQFNNQPMKRKPRKPRSKELKAPMVQCMNSTACCLREGSDQGTLCFSKCRKRDEADERHPCVVTPADVERHTWESDGSRRKCTCPYCASKCNKRFKICDFQNIALRLIARSQLAKGRATRGTRRAWLALCNQATKG